jgi:hypothetical protein
MPRLLKRWYVWLGLVLLLGLAGSVMLIYSSRSRITQANFELVREGMTKAEVLAVLGGCQQELTGRRCSDDHKKWRPIHAPLWREGPDWIWVFVDDDEDKVYSKEIHFATASETLKWYAKKACGEDRRQVD